MYERLNPLTNEELKSTIETAIMEASPNWQMTLSEVGKKVSQRLGITIVDARIREKGEVPGDAVLFENHYFWLQKSNLSISKEYILMCQKV